MEGESSFEERAKIELRYEVWKSVARRPDLSNLNFFIGAGQKDKFINQNPIVHHGFELQIQDVFEHIPHELKRTAVKDATKRLRKCIKNTGSCLENVFVCMFFI